MSAPSIVVIDYGLGNLMSVSNAFASLGCDVTVSSDPAVIQGASGLVLPGVGAFGEGMRNLRSLGLVDVLTACVMNEKKPILGICLGMQLFAETSEENGLFEGLAWVPGAIKNLDPAKNPRVPHVGWNTLNVRHADGLFSRVQQGVHVFFDHSLSFQCSEHIVSADCDYGERIVAAIELDNIFGVQFHPEKSQSNGLRILRGFANCVLGRRESHA